MRARGFRQVDVFADAPYTGNPVAVVLDGDGLTDADMQAFARWTNLSETTFLLPPADAGADYRVRIFTPSTELPFAGHPTLGSCSAWLEAGGAPRRPDVVVQECLAGLVPVRPLDRGFAFAAPRLVRSGPVSDEDLQRVVEALRIDRKDVVDAQWVDNGPGWVAVLLGSADDVLAVRPRPNDLDIGVVGLLPPGSAEALEVRAFFPVGDATVEDPVTGSLNASVAGWLIGTGLVQPPYTARQGTAIGRAGRVRVTTDHDGRIWVGGGTITCVSGSVDL